MQILPTVESLKASDLPPVAWAMGTFDGLHLGHRKVIEGAVERARAMGGVAGVLTFADHPLSMLHPDRVPKQILSGPDEKWALLKDMGVDLVLNLPFTPTLAQLAPIPFLDLICSAHPMLGVSVGVDWRFGARRAGDATCLSAWCAEHDIPCHLVPPVELDGRRVSSTLIRQLIQDGDVEQAACYLGRPYSISGPVVHGRQLARQLGFPTANIVPENGALPPRGVYAVELSIDGSSYLGVANLGVRPTVEGDPATAAVLFEVHVLNYTGDLYNTRLHVHCHRFLRPEQRFDSLDELKQAIAQDKANVLRSPWRASGWRHRV